MIALLGASFLLLAAFIYLYQVPTAPKATSGIPRYDILRELKKLDGKVLTGFRLEGGNRLSNAGRIVSRDIFKAHELVVRFRESTTTFPEFVSQGKKMNGTYSGNRFVAIMYLDGIHEKSVQIPTSPGYEVQYFGPTCGTLIADLWKKVSESREDQLKGLPFK